MTYSQRVTLMLMEGELIQITVLGAEADEDLVLYAPDSPMAQRAVSALRRSYPTHQIVEKGQRPGAVIHAVQTAQALAAGPAAHAGFDRIQLLPDAGGPEAFSFNPVAQFMMEEPDFIMDLMQSVVERSLSDEQYALAKQLAMTAAQAAGTPSVLALVNAWRTAPSLVDFAEAVATSALPR